MVWYSEYKAWLSCIYEGFWKIWQAIALTQASKISFFAYCNDTEENPTLFSEGTSSDMLIKWQGL